MAQHNFLASKGRATIFVASIIYASIVISMALAARLALADSAALIEPLGHPQVLDQ